jgi:hypothetical protein
MQKLYDLETDEVSLVPRGANKKKFLVFKSLKGKKEMANKKVKKDAGGLAPRKDSAVYKDPGMNEPMAHEDGAAYNRPLSDRAQAALKATARILAPHKDELKHEHVAHAMKEAGIHHGAGEEGHDKEEEAMKEEAYPEKVTEEHQAEALEEAKKSFEKAYKEHLEKLGYRKYPDNQEAVKSAHHMEDEDDDDDDGVEKSGVAKGLTNEEDSVSKSKVYKSVDLSVFPENQRRQLTDVFKSYDERVRELVRKNDELHMEVRKRDEEAKEKELIAKAAEFKHLGLEREEIVETLRDASKLGEKAYARVVKQFEALNTQAKSGGLFNEIGTKGNTPAGDADAQIEQLVNSIVQKSDGTRTREEIYAEVLMSAEGQKIYRDYKVNRKGGA